MVRQSPSKTPTKKTRLPGGSEAAPASRWSGSSGRRRSSQRPGSRAWAPGAATSSRRERGRHGGGLPRCGLLSCSAAVHAASARCSVPAPRAGSVGLSAGRSMLSIPSEPSRSARSAAAPRPLDQRLADARLGLVHSRPRSRPRASRGAGAAPRRSSPSRPCAGDPVPGLLRSAMKSGTGRDRLRSAARPRRHPTTSALWAAGRTQRRSPGCRRTGTCHGRRSSSAAPACVRLAGADTSRAGRRPRASPPPRDLAEPSKIARASANWGPASSGIAVGSAW